MGHEPLATGFCLPHTNKLDGICNSCSLRHFYSSANGFLQRHKSSLGKPGKEFENGVKPLCPLKGEPRQEETPSAP